MFIKECSFLISSLKRKKTEDGDEGLSSNGGELSSHNTENADMCKVCAILLFTQPAATFS